MYLHRPLTPLIFVLFPFIPHQFPVSSSSRRTIPQAPDTVASDIIAPTYQCVTALVLVVVATTTTVHTWDITILFVVVVICNNNNQDYVTDCLQYFFVSSLTIHRLPDNTQT
jgi:hypothetical protein